MDNSKRDEIRLEIRYRLRNKKSLKRDELMKKFKVSRTVIDSAIAYEQGRLDALKEQDIHNEGLIKRCREALSRSHKKPFNNDEFRDLLAALHPDANDPSKRLTAFVLVKNRELVLRQVDEADLERKYIRLGIPPLPSSEERESRRAAKKVKGEKNGRDQYKKQ